MKKLLSVVIALTLLLTMGIGVFAEYEDWVEVRIDKNLLLTNEGTISPAETFNFTVGNGQVMEGNAGSAPAFPSGTFSINLGQGQLEGFTDIQLPEYEHVGVYLYEVKESAGDTAGMVYDDETYYLKVTVINDGEDGFKRVLTLVDGNDVKTDAFKNSFSAGNLVINKTITGNYAVFDDEFEVTVILSPPEGKEIKEGPIAISGAVGGLGNVTKNSNGTVTATFMVTHNSNVTIENIPYGVSYVVTENAGEYDSNVPEEGFIGTIGAASASIEIINTLDTEIDMGISLDNLPYILVLATVTLGLFGFTMRKRFTNR